MHKDLIWTSGNRSLVYWPILWYSKEAETMTTINISHYSNSKSVLILVYKCNADIGSTLSTHIWKLKDAGTNYDTSWSIIEKAREFNPTTRKCTLCLKEKYHIIFQPSGATLNSRSELFSTCRHRLDKLLVNT